MNREFEKLEAINFGSWRHLVFDLKDQGNVLIIGRTGSGKSTLFKALAWCAYDRIPVSSHSVIQADEIINEVVGKNTMVKLTMRIDNDRYEITRYRKHQQWKNKVLIHKNGKRFGEKDSKVGVMNKIIEGIMGRDYDSFIKTEYLFQRDTERFPALRDTRQKKLIESLTELKILPFAEKIASAYASEQSTKLSILRERKNQQIESLKTAQSLYTQQNKEQKEREDIIQASIKEARSRLNDVEAELTAFQKDYDESLKESRKANKELMEVEAMYSVLKEEVKRLKEKANKIELLNPGSTCDRCGSVLTTESIQQLYGTIQAEIAKAEEQRDEHKKRLEDSKNLIDDKNIKKLERGIRDAEKKVERWKSYIKVKKEELGKSEKPAQELQTVEYKIIGQLFQTQWLKKSTKRLDHLLELCRKALGKKGMRISFLPQLLKDLETRTNKYLQVFDEEGMILRSQYTMKEGRIIQKYLSTEKKPRSYATLSGGESQMVDICTGLALREMAEASRVSYVDCVILDEPLDGLDDTLIKKVPQLLQLLRKNSVFVISHDSNLIPYFNKVIKIRKKNSTSTFV